jgi:hypothetical protein
VYVSAVYDTDQAAEQQIRVMSSAGCSAASRVRPA